MFVIKFRVRLMAVNEDIEAINARTLYNFQLQLSGTIESVF